MLRQCEYKTFSETVLKVGKDMFHVFEYINPLSANPTKWSNTLKFKQVAWKIKSFITFPVQINRASGHFIDNINQMYLICLCDLQPHMNI